jgi:DNA modification methylase
MIPTVTTLQGHCLEQMATLPSESVHCCVTSPPYWGLRDYGIPPVHWPEVTFSPMAGLPTMTIPEMDCVHGLEKDLWSYVAHEVAVFREVRRVLRDDGTLWLNLGDSYCSQGGMHDGRDDNQPGVGASRMWRNGSGRADGIVDERGQRNRNGNSCSTLKPKDLVGIPWRVAFALQADGWYLRSDIIWHKPNTMPESVTDRPTKAHEYLFLFTKSCRYFYDAEAIKEPVNGGAHAKKSNGANSRMLVERAAGRENSKPNPSRANIGPKASPAGSGIKYNESFESAVSDMVAFRNKRSVWSIPSAPYREAHFATFPPDLVKPCILAGCPLGGIVLDPFLGSGTTAQVSLELGRSAIGCEMNPVYIKLQKSRTNVTPGLPL